MTTYPYLELDCIYIDNSVMKMLPPEIAYRYHALPVATDGKKVTVAMAAPGDQVASRAVKAVIGAPVCLIQADVEEIDNRLTEVWPDNTPPLKFLFWPQTKETNRSYNIAKGIARSLQSNLVRIECPGMGKESLVGLQEAIQQEQPDLLILEANHPSKLCNELTGRKLSKVETRRPDLLFLPPKSNLPLKKLLLVLPNNADGFAEASFWVLRLSQTIRVDVTILPVLPPVPLCYGSFLQHSLGSLLEGNDPLGKNMRLLSKQFSRESISAHYKLREGDPFNQIRDEIIISDPDLIIMPATPRQGREYWFCTDLAGILFKCLTKPILITQQN